MITHLPYVGFIPAPVPIPQPPTPSYAELSEFDRLYVNVPRPAEPTDADRMIAALRRVAKATYAEAATVERVLADNHRLSDEVERLQNELLWWQKEHGFRRMNGEFGSEPGEAA